MKPEPIAEPSELSTRTVTTLGRTDFATAASDPGARWARPGVVAEPLPSGTASPQAAFDGRQVSERTAETTGQQRRQQADEQHLTERDSAARRVDLGGRHRIGLRRGEDERGRGAGIPPRIGAGIRPPGRVSGSAGAVGWRRAAGRRRRVVGSDTATGYSTARRAGRVRAATRPRVVECAGVVRRRHEAAGRIRRPSRLSVRHDIPNRLLVTRSFQDCTRDGMTRSGLRTRVGGFDRIDPAGAATYRIHRTSRARHGGRRRAEGGSLMATTAETNAPRSGRDFAEAFLPEDDVLRVARGLAADAGLTPISPSTGATLCMLAAGHVGARGHRDRHRDRRQRAVAAAWHADRRRPDDDRHRCRAPADGPPYLRGGGTRGQPYPPDHRPGARRAAAARRRRLRPALPRR